jgi:hypothetical protein
LFKFIFGQIQILWKFEYVQIQSLFIIENLFKQKKERNIDIGPNKVGPNRQDTTPPANEYESVFFLFSFGRELVFSNKVTYV